MERKDLEGLTREELIARSAAAGVARPRTLTNPELVEAILRASTAPGRPRGWLDRARDLLTSVIDLGLVGADGRAGAQRGRDGGRAASAPPPLPTVTLAEIYAAQGHLERALVTLDEVLSKDPESSEAARLRDRYHEQIRRTKPSIPPPVVEARMETLQPPARNDGDVATKAADAVASVAEDDGDEGSADVAEEELDVADEVDEIVSLAVDPTTVYLYWEVRAQTLAAARAKDADGALVVRIVGVTPTARGPVTDVRDTRVDALSGELFVRGLPPSTEVRVSVGYKSFARGAGTSTVAFEPFAVGIDLSTPRAVPASDVATEFRKWTEVGHEPGLSAGSIGTRGGRAPMRASEAHDTRVRFPPGVWVEPRTRLVRLTDRDHGGLPEAGSLLTSTGDQSTWELVKRAPGSSEIFRRETVWSASSWSIASQVARAS